MEFESRIIKSAVAALVGIACMTANCAEFLGELYEAEWFSKTDCGFYLPTKVAWDVGDRLFDEYMVVDGVKYPEREYSAAWKNFLLIPVSLGKPGEKFTPVVVNGTTSGEVGVSVMTDEQVYRQFCNSQTDWMRDYWLNKVFPNGKTSSLRAWIKVLPGQSKTKLRANVDLSTRPAPGIYSNYSLTDMAMEYGVDYFKGVFPVAPSTWYAIGIKETGEIFVPTKSGLDSPRLYVCQLVSCKEFFKAFSIDDMEETMGEDRCEAIVCPAAWYVSAKDAGGAELVVWSENIRMGAVSGNGIYKPGTKVSLKATANKGFVFAGWYDADGNPLTGGSVDYRTATYAYVTTDKDVTLTAKFATNSEDAESLALVNITNCTAGAGSAFAKEMSPHVVSHSTPKLAVTGLPAGLKYDAKTMTISGKATKPGVYTVTVSATNASVKKATPATTKTFTITVPNFETSALPKLNPATDAYVLTVGVVNEESVLDLKAADGYSVSAVSGLPAGLKYDKKTNTVTGKPTKPGTYTVTVTATKGKDKQVAMITITVDPLPSWAVGTFYGYMYSKGYTGSGAGRTDYVTWECADLLKIDVSAAGVVKITGTYYDDGGKIGKDLRTVALSNFDKVNERLEFEWSYTERDGGPEMGIYQESATGAIFRNVELSEALGVDIGEIEFKSDGTDGWNDDDETFGFAQKNVFSMNSLGVVLPDVNGETCTDIFNNVKSTEREYARVSGRLDFIFGAEGLVSPVWKPDGAGSRTKKLAQKTYLMLDDFDAEEGMAICRLFVSAYDNVNGEREYGFVYILQISETGEVVDPLRERVLIDEL